MNNVNTCGLDHTPNAATAKALRELRETKPKFGRGARRHRKRRASQGKKR